VAVVPALQTPVKTLREPRSTLAFQCKCGSEFFRVDVEIYADYGWAPILSCVACGQICEPTEPLTNGPH
jgi:hypothetical protein